MHHIEGVSSGLEYTLLNAFPKVALFLGSSGRRSRHIRGFDGFFSTVFKYARFFRANSKEEKAANLQTLASTFQVYGKTALPSTKQRAGF